MLGFLKKKLKQKENMKKVVVLGIDGVPCSLLERFIKDGIMPNFARLVLKGTLSPMTASIPEVSSTSWSTFMTGVNPGKHGIYGFTELQKGSYKWKFPNSNDINSETLWETAGKNNRKSIVLNVPSTYPAKKINGVLTAGFVALDLKKATYPESAYEYLTGIGYKMDVNLQKVLNSGDALAEEINNAFDKRKRAILHFLDNGDWELFIGVITETDRLHHYLWNALEDEEHELHGFFIDFYRRLDELIGEIYERVGQDIPFIILSDHGFATIKKEVYLNVWLKEKGYLKYKKEKPESMEDMDGASSVFALDPSRLYIHLKGKYPAGSVDAAEYNDLRKKIKDDLLSLDVDGEKVIKRVMYKDELYNGDLIDNAPDLVALPYDGYDLKGAVNKAKITGKSFLTGGHTRENAVFFINRQITCKDINIIDVAPTIMTLLEIDWNKYDGKSLI